MQSACAYLVQALSSAGVMMAVVYVPLLAQRLGANGSQIGLLVAAYQAMMLLSNMLFGRWADFTDRKRVVVLGLLLSALALSAHLLATGLLRLFVVRAVAENGESDDRAGAEHDVWMPHSVGNINGADYVRLMRMPAYERELDVVAVAPDGSIAAYVNGWLDPLNRIGDFGPVGARPAYRRKGLTRAVLLECARRMRARGMQRICVSTTHTNEAARRLYESLGFRSVNQYLDYEKPPS